MNFEKHDRAFLRTEWSFENILKKYTIRPSPLSLLLFFLASCKDDKMYLSLIDRAESIRATNPDSSRILLDSVAVPDNLSDKQLARWCMLYGELADTLFIDLPYTLRLQCAASHYKSHGTPSEQARIGLYQGRAYVDDENHEMLMYLVS